MSTMAIGKGRMPAWADELRRRYLRGESAQFVLHGNVYDTVVHGQRSYALTEFLTDVLLKDGNRWLFIAWSGGDDPED